ncbi:GATA zinc finger domain-containing protein 14-like [Centruroides sculpturatus]|uniref:GATA zinc finger domain-containing protein 14-like n=1 Tax=Centruroides sculpturatus TaxID=218467 RepID=UPI000C6E5DE8|nr:GATA zinc finger domain-containing protein 14-like [Centruroides sculpturatus]
MQENYEIKVMRMQKNLMKLQINELKSQENEEIHSNIETTKSKVSSKEENEFKNKSPNVHKNYTENNSVNNFIRTKTYNNGYRKTGYENHYLHSKQSYFERGRRGQRGSRIATRVNNYRGRYRGSNRERFPSRRDMEDMNYRPGFKRENPRDINSDDGLINRQSVLELVPATEEEEEEMLRQAVQLSKQQMFIERLQKKQLEKVLQNDIGISESLPNVAEDKREKQEIHPSSSNNRDFNLSENNNKFQKQFKNEDSHNEYKSKYLENGNCSRSPRSPNSYPSNSKYRNNYTNNVIQNHQRNNTRKHVDDTTISNRLFISSIRSIKQSNESKSFNSSLKISSSERTKSTHKDDWNSIASKDLKTMLHIGSTNDDKINFKKEAKYLNEIEFSTTSNSNNESSGKEYQNTKSEKEIKYDHWNKYREQRNSTYHFNKYNANFSCIRGGMHRMRNNQRHYGARGGRNYHSTYSNANELEWKPYSKQVEEGRFDNVPPRFKRMMNNRNVTEK